MPEILTGIDGWTFLIIIVGVYASGVLIIVDAIKTYQGRNK
jgi:hypothetical protein